MEQSKQYLTIRAASDQTGLSVNTIRWWADHKGIGARINGRPMVDAAALRAKLDDGKSTLTSTDAARKYGVTSNTIVNWSAAFGIGDFVDGKWRIDPAKLEALVEKRGIPGPSLARRIPAASDQGSAA
jgi:hypothetical protein